MHVARSHPYLSPGVTSRSVAGTLIAFALVGATLLAKGDKEYPQLHAILDTGGFLLSGLLASLFWEMGARLDRPLPKRIAVSFAVTSLLELIHILVAVEWSGVLAPIAQTEHVLRPSTWPPAAYVLPVGITGAVLCGRHGEPRLAAFTSVLLALGAGFIALFDWLPKYLPPSWLGISRPTLLFVPLLWAFASWLCWRQRNEERALPILALMAVVLIPAHLSMLYSHAPHDAAAMVAHFGKVCGYLFVLLRLMHMASSDRLERIRAERELAQLNEELERRVLERTAQLGSMNRLLEAEVAERKHAEEELRGRTAELVRSNQDLEQFAYVASHDLQEPLRAVSGSLQLLQHRYQGELDARADEFIGHAVDGAARMQTLTDDLLTYSRVGRSEEPLQPTDCVRALDQALANLIAVIQETGAEVSRDALPVVRAIPAQLALLFQNLVGNAIKFRRKDHPVRVHVGARSDGDTCVLSVKDNGIGIDPQYFERIFLIFQRLHTRRDYPGTGIGLALCKRIVEHHGGRIWVESAPGEGTTFFFTLRKLAETKRDIEDKAPG